LLAKTIQFLDIENPKKIQQSTPYGKFIVTCVAKPNPGAAKSHSSLMKLLLDAAPVPTVRHRT
jgi:hypothetical protein